MERVLPEMIRSLLAVDPGHQYDPDRVYHIAVATLIEHLLSSRERPATYSPSPWTGTEGELLILREIEEIGYIGPLQVGRVYEHLRGFRLEMQRGNEPLLVQCAKGKRNQGLFYTPPHIVEHIVAATLDGLDIRNPSGLVHIRILDPAVGPGLFLAEALEQLTRRILGAADTPSSPVVGQIDRMTGHYGALMRRHGIEGTPDAEQAVRLHVMERCLYGVDLDPVALTIARALLLDKAYRDLPTIPGVTPAVRHGNSLIGEGVGAATAMGLAEANRAHFEAYVGRAVSRTGPDGDLCEQLRMVHWPLDYPHVFSGENPGFDAVVGNPPYEIVSVKESGIGERRREQIYFRKMYATCSGKINTYRLMVERGVNLLRKGGILGFIVPATLLGDSTASGLREEILARSRVLQAVVIPEKARVFQGVTQALLILVTQKGSGTQRLSTVVWNGKGPINGAAGVEVSTEVIRKTRMRIPLFRTTRERELLEALLIFAPLGGTEEVPPAALVHQGEINLTTQRRFITDEPTSLPLIRGEHIQPFHVHHPSSRQGRLDWISEDFLDEIESQPSADKRTSPAVISRIRSRGRPWEYERIALGRVVNMATRRRLKAALVPPGTFLGDMTNFLARMRVSRYYLLGLLNSRLLNWRIKLTSTNNYLSAAELEALPIPRVSSADKSREEVLGLNALAAKTVPHLSGSLSMCLKILEHATSGRIPTGPSHITAELIEWGVSEHLSCDEHTVVRDEYLPCLQNLMDCLVLKLFNVDTLAEVVDGDSGVR